MSYRTYDFAQGACSPGHLRYVCRHNRSVFLIITLAFAALLSACSLPMPDAYVREDYDASMIRKIAVFPFHNRTKAREASKVVTAAFMERLVEEGRFQVEFPGNITSFLVSERIIVRTGLDLDAIKLMGKRLGVDVVILGEVDEFVGSGEKKRDVIPVVSISARMVDARTGRVLWMAQLRRTGDDYIKVLDFGKVRSVGALTKKVAGEMIHTMQ